MGCIEQPDFDEWMTWLNDPSTLPDAYVIAVQGDEYVGLRELGYARAPEWQQCQKDIN
jgi:hypothetical protein